MTPRLIYANTPPEILVQIFSFLSQHTLKFSVYYVCKAWRILATSLLVKSIVVDGSNYGSDIKYFKYLECATELHLKNDIDWDYLADKLSEVGLDAIRISRLELENVINISQMVYSTLKSIVTLTDVHLSGCFDNVICVGLILQLCPRLVRLHVESKSKTYPTIVDITANLTADETQGDSSVKSLVVKGISVEQCNFENILRRCRQLLNLRLEAIHYATNQEKLFNRLSFYKNVANLCPLLKKFHFSHVTERLSQNQAMIISTLFYKLSSSNSSNNWGRSMNAVSVVDADICYLTAIHIFKPITVAGQENFVTTLEITALKGGGRISDCVIHALHNILCSAPSLLHLLAPKIPYFLEYIRISKYISDRSKPGLWNCDYAPCPVSNFDYFHLSKYWVCRKLRTLQLRFVSKLNPRYKVDVHSKYLCWYISEACLNLRDLSICCHKLDMGANDGLGQLSKLRELETLSIRMWDNTPISGKTLRWMGQGNNKVADDSPEPNIRQERCWPKLERLNIRHTNLHRGDKKGEYLRRIILHLRPDIEFSCEDKEYLTTSR